MSLGPEKRYERELQRQAAFDKLMPRSEFAPIGCLRCRRCVVTPETSFDSSIVRIYCENRKRMMPAYIEEPCPFADPRPARPKRLHRLWVNHGDLGDRAGAATPLLLMYLRKFWTSAGAEQLEKHTGRTVNSLRQIVNAYGIGGAGTARHRIRLSGRDRAKKYFTAEQTAFLERTYNSPMWPGQLTYNRTPEKREEILRRREWILNQVAQMGPHWTWHQITRHLITRRARLNASRRAVKCKAALCKAVQP